MGAVGTHARSGLQAEGVLILNTDAWVDMLARGAGAAPRAVAARRLGPAACAGLLASALLAMLILDPLPASAFASGSTWMKLVYTGTFAVAAGWLAARAARPVARTRQPTRAVLVLVVLMVGLGLAALLFDTAPGGRMDVLMGSTALQCPWLVLGLSLPALGLSFWAMRGLAPTQLRIAGFAAGLLAGAVGAFGYSLACPEASVAFVAVWYTLGIALTGVLGALLGPRALRW